MSDYPQILVNVPDWNGKHRHTEQEKTGRKISIRLNNMKVDGEKYQENILEVFLSIVHLS